MTDYSIYLISAKSALRVAEDAAALHKWDDGVQAIIRARDALDEAARAMMGMADKGNGS